MGKLEKKKVDLAQRILANQDQAMIDHIAALLDTHADDWWNTLPPRVKASVQRSEAQLGRGEVVASEEVSKRIRRWAAR